jgi:hypothetical protein
MQLAAVQFSTCNNESLLYGPLHVSCIMHKFTVRNISPGSIGAEREINEPAEKGNKNTLSVVH